MIFKVFKINSYIQVPNFLWWNSIGSIRQCNAKKRRLRYLQLGGILATMTILHDSSFLVVTILNFSTEYEFSLHYRTTLKFLSLWLNFEIKCLCVKLFVTIVVGIFVHFYNNYRRNHVHSSTLHEESYFEVQDCLELSPNLRILTWIDKTSGYSQ